MPDLIKTGRGPTRDELDRMTPRFDPAEWAREYVDRQARMKWVLEALGMPPDTEDGVYRGEPGPVRADPVGAVLPLKTPIPTPPSPPEGFSEWLTETLEGGGHLPSAVIKAGYHMLPTYGQKWLSGEYRDQENIPLEDFDIEQGAGLPGVGAGAMVHWRRPIEKAFVFRGLVDQAGSPEELFMLDKLLSHNKAQTYTEMPTSIVTPSRPGTVTNEGIMFHAPHPRSIRQAGPRDLWSSRTDKGATEDLVFDSFKEEPSKPLLPKEKLPSFKKREQARKLLFEKLQDYRGPMTPELEIKLDKLRSFLSAENERYKVWTSLAEPARRWRAGKEFAFDPERGQMGRGTLSPTEASIEEFFEKQDTRPFNEAILRYPFKTTPREQIAGVRVSENTPNPLLMELAKKHDLPVFSWPHAYYGKMRDIFPDALTGEWGIEPAARIKGFPNVPAWGPRYPYESLPEIADLLKNTRRHWTNEDDVFMDFDPEIFKEAAEAPKY